MSNLAAPTVAPLRAPDRRPVLGIGTATPRLSWQVAGRGRRLRAGGVRGRDHRPGRRRSTRSESAEQVLVPWPGDPLASRESAQVRVRVRGDGDWSRLERAGDRRGRPARPGRLDRALRQPARHRRARLTRARCSPASLDLPDGIVRARLYATAHGVYTAELNGDRVGDHELAPGWTATSTGCATRPTTSPTWSAPARTSSRCCSATAGTAAGSASRTGRALYGDRLALLAQLEVTTADGTVHVLGTDDSWTARESAILADDLYDGQRTDLRRTAGRAAATGRGARRRPRPASSPPTARRCASPRSLPAVEVSHARRPARRWSTSARTSSAGSG